jgi:hypothetical protein
VQPCCQRLEVRDILGLFLVKQAVIDKALFRALAKFVIAHRGARDSDDRHFQMAAPGHGEERGKDLLVGEVAGGAEQHQRIRLRFTHGLRST